MNFFFSGHLFCAIVLIVLSSSSFSQENLVVNGDFSSEDGWNDLGQYEGGVATGTFENGTYVIDISQPGNQVWAIQFSQNNITLESGTFYTFSYALSCNINRTIEVSLSRNGGDYVSYSGRDTVQVTSELKVETKNFVMNHATDNNVRLEFNCGKATGKIIIQDIFLTVNTTPQLHLTVSNSNRRYYAGIPYQITWNSININEGVIIELSTDNGASWSVIDTVPADSGYYRWTPRDEFSPWCRIRITSSSDTTITSTSELPFEIVPRRELIVNGSFDLIDLWDIWNFDVLGGSAQGIVSNDSTYRITMETTGDEYWQVKLYQIGVPLFEDLTYTFAFSAYSSSETKMQVNIGMDHEPYSSYFDTTRWIVDLTGEPRHYPFDFTMEFEDDSSARVEFNCGRSSGTIVIDDISLVPQYKAPAIIGDNHISSSSVHKAVRFIYTENKPRISIKTPTIEPYRSIDLSGRRISTGYSNNRSASFCNVSSGLYISGQKQR